MTFSNKANIRKDAPRSLEDTTSEFAIRRAVRQWYAKVAQSASEQCCQIGLDDGKLVSVSEGGCCSSALERGEIREGMVVVDLGSGLGRGVFVASRLVGPIGRVIGVDTTPEMVWKAREIAEIEHYNNVEFRLGEIEHLPVESNSADLVMSNCVINLLPDKTRAFREAYRILKPQGRLIVSDIVSAVRVPDEVRKNLSLWSACIGGVLEERNYLELMKKVGFTKVEVRNRQALRDAQTFGCCCSAKIDTLKLFDVTFSAVR